MTEDSLEPTCEICGGGGSAQLVLDAGPNPRVTPPLDCPQCNNGDWELWEHLMPYGWNRGKWQ